MRTNPQARPSWFHTITHPGTRLFFTIGTFVAFFGGVALGVSFPAFQLWFQVPAVLVLMMWFVIMSELYYRARAARR